MTWSKCSRAIFCKFQIIFKLHNFHKIIEKSTLNVAHCCCSADTACDVFSVKVVKWRNPINFSLLPQISPSYSLFFSLAFQSSQNYRDWKQCDLFLQGIKQHKIPDIIRNLTWDVDTLSHMIFIERLTVHACMSDN